MTTTVDFLPKTFLILYPSLENSTTGIAIASSNSVTPSFSGARLLPHQIGSLGTSAKLGHRKKRPKMVSKKKYPTRINKTLLERFFIITLYVLYFSAVIKKKSSGDIFIVIIFHPAEFLWRQFFYCGAIMLVSKKS